MTPANITNISSQLRQLIYYHLDNNLVRNALFLAGRLVAYEPRSSEAAYLLAYCQFQSGQLKAAWDTTRIHASRGTHLGCCYIYAQASLELGRYVEGMTALERSKGSWQHRNTWNQHSDTKRQHLPDAAAVYCLEGKLWHAHKDVNKAIDCWIEALKLNPFMWDAFMGLCDTGLEGIRIPNVYKMTTEMLAHLSTAHSSESSSSGSNDRPASLNGPLQSHPTNNANHIPSGTDPFTSSTNLVNGNSTSNSGSSALWEKLNGSTVSVASTSGGVGVEGAETPVAQSDFDEPNARMAVGTGTSKSAWEPPMAPSRKPRSAQEMGIDFGAEGPSKMRNGSLKSRVKTKVDSEEAPVLQVPSQSQLQPPTGPSERKRTISGQAAHTTAPQIEPGAPTQRRSVRLLNTIRPTTSKFSTTGSLGLKDGRELKKAKATGTKGRAAAASQVGRVVSGNRKHMADSMDIDSKDSRSTAATTNVTGGSQSSQRSAASNDKTKETEALQSMLDLFAKISSGYLALSNYRCQEAVQIFNSLPTAQRETPWVLAQIGRAYYEQALYPEAEKYFIRIKTMAPSRLEDMEIYSTVLWHLKNEVELAYLAHELMEVERLSPQAWCAIGNSFSLQRDHDQALKCFKRATQLDPKFAYGFTLQGHEHVANEEYDKAMDAYRHGISADSRHYNAWYGLGKVFEKMGKYDFAEQHYRTAARINPTNAVLVCCIGVIMEKMKNLEAALMLYSQACALAPQSALSRFKKARCLMSMGEPKLALVELRILKDIAPDEANVHFLLGRLYKMLHEKANAIKHFTTALNLDPKAAQYIKDAMESLDEEDDDDADGEMS